MLALEAFSIAVFAATDVFLFYVVFEATLIPAYFLIGGFGREGRSRAAVKFLMYQLGGGLVMLGVGRSASTSSPPTPGTPVVPHHRPGRSSTSTTTPQRWLFVGFFIAFAIKAPLFPVHTWLADTTEKATPGTQRAAGLHPRQDRHVRHDPVLPRAAARRRRSGRRRSWSCWR